ncbi:MAG TPA: hypothetical protein VF169_18260 [Albitalea sp.]|uniref:hypothetical protein n=1 Tax=Piscinibacter sp. TaxID=1903157 RepID=UPI002ED1410E
MNRTSSSHRRAERADRAARALGWFSVGLGLAELLAPRALGRAIGLRDGDGLLQAYGLREIATGVGLLTARNKAPWLWARVGGDALDLATLGAMAEPRRAGTAAAIAAVAGVAAVDVATARAVQVQRLVRRPVRDYSDRRGLPLPPQEMRGAALLDFDMPADLRTPAALRPLESA